MGFQDRNYYRDDPPRGFESNWDSKSPTAIIIIICAVVFFVNLFIETEDKRRLSDFLALNTEDAMKPWMWWRLLTYGFAHDYRSIGHLLFNMLGLWFVGRAVEERYGWAEFWRIYLVSIVLGGIVFLVGRNATGMPASVVGASGAVIAVTMLFVFNYPRQQILLMMFFPVEAWILGVIIVVSNFFFASGRESTVAYDVHSVGILFAAAYFYGNWSLAFMSGWSYRYGALKRRLFGPKLRTFRGDDDKQNDAEEADRLLNKIHTSGQDSLTKKERKFLESYSKKVRERQQRQ
jgi:membrane associated rhomboid family serine protease